jgi:hypothetical protein
MSRSMPYIPTNPSRWSASTASTFVDSIPTDITFQYYVPELSTSRTDFYNEDCVAGADEDSGSEPASHDNLELPFIHEDNFPYYPEQRCELPSYETNGSLEGDSVARSEIKEVEVVKKEKSVSRLLRKLRLKK